MGILTIIGVLILVLTGLLTTKLQLTVVDETCSQDVEAVRINKIGVTCLFVVGGICTIVGIIGLIF